MDAQQRFLRRKYLMDNIDVFLRESNYHRTHDEAESREGVVVWEWDQEEGTSANPL